ncbi:hypothetical protein Scel_05850 [Streptomyces cellostaticus]|nr:hypothetical protein Scel_05850 [Streptomyces cellostaticus]
MRHLEGDDGDCPFCGGEESTVVSEPWQAEGETRDWSVCLECGTSNQRRVRIR